MVDKILNNVSNLDARNSSNSNKSKSSDTTVKIDTADNVSESIKANKKLISELSQAAPVDSDKVAKIKKAISSGNYPLDLEKVSDALMQAYREMKS